MPPILTDAERDKFVSLLDTWTDDAAAQRYGFETISDRVSAARCSVEEIAFRIVALKMRQQQVVQSVIPEIGGHPCPSAPSS